MKSFLYTFVLALLLPANASAVLQVENASMFQEDSSDAVVYAGEVLLPDNGAWKLLSSTDRDVRTRYYLLSPGDKKILASFHKKALDRQSRLIMKSQGLLKSYYRIITEYAGLHNNTGPRSLEELDQKKRDSLERSFAAWSAETGRTLQGPFVYLVPEVRFEIDAGTRGVSSRTKKVLMLELQPYLDDGKQWKLYTDGSCVREAIDQELLAAYNLAVRPVTDKKGLPSQEQKTDDNEDSYTLFAVRNITTKSAPFALTFENTSTGEQIEITWQPDQFIQENREITKQLDFARFLAWAPYRAANPASPVYRQWMERKGWGGYFPDSRRSLVRDRAGRELTVFSFIGGRAAVEETLQMQALNPAEEKVPGQNIPVSSIKGVEVQSHPFDSMLAGVQGGSLSLADYVPPDHFFVYSPKPAAILPFLDDGARFMANLGGIIQSNSIRYDLKDRYLSRLGLDGKWLQKFIESGVVKETAFVFPDVFFVEGTDVTVISRLAVPKLLAPFLSMVGINGLAGENIFTRTLDNGQKVLWALRDDLLVISTSSSEMESVLGLHAAAGQGSLGKSAEFSYMLSQTPVLPQTRFYAYFSDPFIRRLVGPETKIGQLRRLTVRKDLEELTGAMLLAESEGYRGPLTTAGLVASGYADPRFAAGDLSIDKDGVTRSSVYGSLAGLRSLDSVALENASEQEVEAYNQYLENYNRYWLQYFDPIAIRLDDAPDTSLELTTFILPLLNNSIYNAMKELLVTRENGSRLNVPVTSPGPVVMFSMNLQDKGQQGLARNGMGLVDRYTHIHPGILSDLGPAIHLAIMDADPVIALGSGDILGAFNANTMGIARGGMMMLMPVAMSVLTRPCTLYIETGNPDKTLGYLRRASAPVLSPFQRPNEVDIDFYQIDGRDEWIYSFNLFGLIKLRYGIAVQDNYLVVRNIPWTPREQIESVREVPLNGALLQAFPAACDSQLPGIFTSASERNRNASLQGMSYLYPLVASGHASIEDAPAEHARLFGFRPAHPGDGSWAWDGQDLVSDKYGSVKEQRQPPYEKGEANFGLLNDIDTVSLNLQFEDTGLRTKLKWSLR